LKTCQQSTLEAAEKSQLERKLGIKTRRKRQKIKRTHTSKSFEESVFPRFKYKWALPSPQVFLFGGGVRSASQRANTSATGTLLLCSSMRATTGLARTLASLGRLKAGKEVA